jgi:Zn-dependent alcohol dehydrogenase
MKALVLNAIGREFELEDVEIAAPIGREVLVDVQACGLCHTDMLFATNPIFPKPAVYGHEVSGIVTKVGLEVTQFQVGDHVLGSLAQTCGSCAKCQSGYSFQCQLYLLGVSKPEVNMDLNIFDAIGGQKRVQGVNFGSTNFKRDIPMYAELYLQGRMNLDDLVSKKIALRDVNEGYAVLKDGSLNRVVVTSF